MGALTLCGGVGVGDRPLVPLSPIFIGLWAVGLVGAVGAAWQAKFHRLAALMLAGVTGAVTCVTFIWFSAPDLALTQLTVEVMTTLLILARAALAPRARAGPRRLQPRARGRRRSGRRARDFVIALAAGTGMAILAYAVMTRDLPERTSFFLEQALTGGGGRNVVNVMLVDFRGFDTFGEGVVLALVALTVYALLRRFRPAPEVLALPPQQQALRDRGRADRSRRARGPGAGHRGRDTCWSRAVLAPVMLPVSGIVATFFFLRGHNAPGGGFVAGLVMAVGLARSSTSPSGRTGSRIACASRPAALIGVGLLLVLGTGAGSFVVGYPLLTSHTFHLARPARSARSTSAARMFFDLGVFCVVLGSTLLILVALAHQSIRAHRRKGGE